MLETQSILMHEIGRGGLAHVLHRSAAIVLMVIVACRFRLPCRSDAPRGRACVDEAAVVSDAGERLHLVLSQRN